MGSELCSVCGVEVIGTEGNCSRCSLLSNKSNELPKGVKGWSWGAFWLSFIWAIGNRVWIGLLVLVPYIGFLVVIWLGVKGRELAWKTGKWQSVEEFQRSQSKWNICGWILVSVLPLLMILSLVLSETHRELWASTTNIISNNSSLEGNEKTSVHETKKGTLNYLATPKKIEQQVRPSTVDDQDALIDCSVASSDVERMICGSVILTTLDSELNENYKKATAIMDQELLRREQQHWLAQRNQCEDEQCLINTYSLRNAELAGETE